MRLYHASPVKISHPDVEHSRENVDFGKGFYLTALEDQARSYAQRFLLRGKKAFLHIYDLDEEMPGIRKKCFDAYDEDWLNFVTQCRRGAQPKKIDVVEGGVANDRVFNTIDLYFSGLISKEEALGRLRYVLPNHQLCILSQEVLDRYLHLVEIREIAS